MRYLPEEVIIVMEKRIRLLLGSLAVVLMGCADRTCQPEVRVHTEYINVPTACKVDLPPPPEFKVKKDKENYEYTNTVKNVMSLIIYTEQLEMALWCCTEDPRCITNSK